jgi:hypothetical protein
MNTSQHRMMALAAVCGFGEAGLKELNTPFAARNILCHDASVIVEHSQGFCVPPNYDVSLEKCRNWAANVAGFLFSAVSF